MEEEINKENQKRFEERIKRSAIRILSFLKYNAPHYIISSEIANCMRLALVAYGKVAGKAFHNQLFSPLREIAGVCSGCLNDTKTGESYCDVCSKEFEEFEKAHMEDEATVVEKPEEK